jgi:hypothetical protein
LSRASGGSLLLVSNGVMTITPVSASLGHTPLA